MAQSICYLLASFGLDHNLTPQVDVEVKTANIKEARISGFRRLLGFGREEFGKDLKLRLESEANFEMMPQIWECVRAPQL